MFGLAPLNSQAAMDKEHYNSSKERIKSDYESAKASCDSLAGNAKDICIAEAKGKEKVAKADLEANYTGKKKDWYDLSLAKADAAYEVAKEKCDDKGGNDKDVCLKAAKAEKTKAEAEAERHYKIAKANTAAAKDEEKADYKVAKEKCDMFSGSAKDDCINAAKSKYDVK